MDALFVAVSDNAWLVYFLSFVLVFLEASGLPLPALTFALLAAALAGQGTVGFFPVVVAVILGGTLGGPVGYALGFRKGLPLLNGIGTHVKLTPARIDASMKEFDKRGNMLVAARYFVPILPWSAGLAAGTIKMHQRSFNFLNFLGITLWAIIEMGLAAYSVSLLEDLLSRISFTALFLLLTGVIGTVVLIRFFRKRKRK